MSKVIQYPKSARVDKLQAEQCTLADQLDLNPPDNVRKKINKQYDLTVVELIKELSEFTHCNEIDPLLFELFHSVKDEHFTRDASYEYVLQWYERTKDANDICI
jgi:hypothetical protein